MVSVTAAHLLASRLAVLFDVVHESLETAGDQSRGFSLRVLGTILRNSENVPQFDLKSLAENVQYGGVPSTAHLGYALAAKRLEVGSELEISAFLDAVERIRSRSGDRLDDFLSDELSVLGVADGLSALGIQRTGAAESIEWLSELLTRAPRIGLWSDRLLDTASELVNPRGRLHLAVPATEHDILSLDLCLRGTWPNAYGHASYPGLDVQQDLMHMLLTKSAPDVGDLDRAAVWLGALDVLSRNISAVLVPSVSETGRLLAATQTAFKRWVCDETSGRRGLRAVRWIIDDEYHVQSFLWSVLYPVFRENLRDEEYLPSLGLRKPRADLGIVNLKLIIEVKILRTRGDYEKVEEEIRGDLGIYFSEPHRFDKLIAYIYDDCDKHYPELHGVLRNALKQSDSRVQDVIIIRRPSQLPGRSQRGQ